uniref:DZANK-type domain-containing protein n=1 Tax=viral metagenome TaxID=1070528 RepID=A0A6M3L6G2_9ZZZZ
MAKKIKLENINEIRQEHKHDGIDYNKSKFCPKCGAKTTSLIVVEEYVCQGCRHLVQPLEEFCGFCGESLVDSNLIEHHISISQVDDVLFQTIKGKIK